MKIPATLTDPPNARALASRHFLLASSGILLIWSVIWRLRLSDDYAGDRNGGLVIALMLLLNTVAFFYTWSTRTMVVLRGVAIAWIVFGLGYFVWRSGAW